MSIQRIGVIGAGQMGSGIAQVGAQCGFDMFLLDQNPEAALRAQARIERTLGVLVDKGKLDDATRAGTLARIKPVMDYASLSDCDLIIEAAVELAAVKCEIFKQVEAVTRPDVILASNTSSISITSLAASTSRPERVIGIHFMNPPPVMRLVEIIRGLQTSDDTVERAKEVTAKMGKVVVSARDMPGFIVNRMLIPFLNEACFALQEG
ncbi:MAG TPA: 3-hydroxyacyl-CoA dehydrogenase NAD-binding domain-containing protein, partial [Polyangiaceae bacterium]